MGTRRQFLQSVTAACGGCLGVGQLAPAWWNTIALAAAANTTGRRLVVIELEGGNDGLNTVVPFTDDLYYKARPNLGIKPDKVLKLNDQLGLHPGMKPWQKFWDAGQLAIVENCGYPNPNRSHFESMDIWHAGQLDASVPAGWLGRAADNAAAGELCYVGDGSVPHALSRRLRAVPSLGRLADLKLQPEAADVLTATAAAGDDLAAAVALRLQSARDLSARLPMPKEEPNPTAQGNNELSDRLGVIRTLMEQDQPFRIYYTSLGGFDTHAAQANTHENLWEDVTAGVAGFLDGLKASKLSEGVTVFLFSEFGRRVHENGSIGTDHGAAAPVFLLGDGVKGGLQGGLPNLADLDDDDLRYQVDFRDVYAALLTDWLSVDPTNVLGPRDKKLTLFG